ncbi:MAG: hypothetical protein GQ570_06445 [Helicobacteraceae bacterium]|nr:hypothetical protein [Helicobacteraceae bacterium]
MKFILIFMIGMLFFYANIVATDLVTKKVISQAEKKYGKFSKNRFLDMDKALLKKLKSQSTAKKLNTVNNWVNYIKYKSDKKVYGVKDYWATLYEFVGKGKGDCEDYTIAKYYILKELGVDPKRMKFAYVVYKDRRGKKVSHMVLAYLKKKKPKSRKDILILDNNNKKILPASKRKDIIKVVKLINGDTGAKSKKWKKLEAGMKRKKL